MRFSSPPGLVRSHLPFLLSPSVLGVLFVPLPLSPLAPFSFPFLYQFVSFLLSTVLLPNFSHCPLAFVPFPSMSVVFFGSLLSLFLPHSPFFPFSVLPLTLLSSLFLFSLSFFSFFSPPFSSNHSSPLFLLSSLESISWTFSAPENNCASVTLSLSHSHFL
ncbi:hypothetical protein BKA57DRAFT_37836 [Linnemannia elongata]|nr:hypothetical protein BKA57DRAFT_37836 [Linnemannia elongata]